MENPAPIFVSIDTTSVEKATSLTLSLQGLVAGVKLGKTFFMKNGPSGVLQVKKTRVPLFLDLKFHDIPNTVIGAIDAACLLKPAILNVHTAGGSAMMKGAANAVRQVNKSNRPLLLGVTILTSLEEKDLLEVGFQDNLDDLVLRLALLAQRCGLDGVVCSPKEVKKLRSACGPEFKLITPGIRLDGTEPDDQKRTMTPLEAINSGADILVIGRPITASENPAEAAKVIASSLRNDNK